MEKELEEIDIKDIIEYEGVVSLFGKFIKKYSKEIDIIDKGNKIDDYKKDEIKACLEFLKKGEDNIEADDKEVLELIFNKISEQVNENQNDDNKERDVTNQNDDNKEDVVTNKNEGNETNEDDVTNQGGEEEDKEESLVKKTLKKRKTKRKNLKKRKTKK